MTGHSPLIQGPVVVTGGGQGLGRAFCLTLAERGAAVAVVDIDGARAKAVASEVTSLGGQAVSIATDVTDQQSVASMAATVTERLGPPVGLVNNAALFSSLTMRSFDAISPSEWRDVLEVNTTGAFLCCRELVPPMASRGYGKVVNISSATIWTGRPGYLHYVTSKAALIGLTRALASEVGPAGVRVNAVTPGSTKTEVPRETITDEGRTEMAKQLALRRVQVSDDLVGTVCFLLSHDSDFITGQTINVDGGFAFH